MKLDEARLVNSGPPESFEFIHEIRAGKAGALKIIRMLETVLGITVLTCVICFFAGIAATMLAILGGTTLVKDQTWTPSVIGLEYGFPAGLVLGVLVVVKKHLNRNSHLAHQHGTIEH
jgi:hypothetical protein